MHKTDEHRFFLKDTLRKSVDFRLTDQNKGLPAPALEKPFAADAHRISLPGYKQWAEHVENKDIVSVISQRRSTRIFKSRNLKIEELSFLLWSTQGLSDPAGKNPSLRTVPSAGARHSLETYLFIMGVDELTPGLYRYLPLENELLELLEPDDILVDGGNTHYIDDVRRAEAAQKYEVNYLDVGVSGGIWGLKEGFCMMIGGPEQVFEQLKPFLHSLAPEALVNVTPEDNYVLYLEFDNGEQGWMDMKPFLDYGVFQKIKDQNMVQQFRIKFDTVEWFS